jgi:hypothetical protein
MNNIDKCYGIMLVLALLEYVINFGRVCLIQLIRIPHLYARQHPIYLTFQKWDF